MKVPGVDYTPEIITALKKHGLTDPGEIKYSVDKICEAYRGADTSCADNFRLSVNGVQDKEYSEALSNGCCGFHDDTIKLKSGNTVKFGYNYGH